MNEHTAYPAPTPDNDNALDSVQDAVPARRVTRHRAPAVRLPADPDEASAQALAFIRGDAAFERSGALETMRERVEVLLDADSDDALRGMAAQLPILEALWLRNAALSTEAPNPEHSQRYLKMALSAQAAFTRLQALIAGLRAQRAGRGSVDVDSED